MTSLLKYSYVFYSLKFASSAGIRLNERMNEKQSTTTSIVFSFI
ncbi:hypothetical protein DOY81_003868, partial [Sarcophaga bullata]